MTLILALAGHLSWLLVSLLMGSMLTRTVLEQLEPRPAAVVRPGARNAGRWIGFGERALIYFAIVGALPWIVPVVVGLKTLVRFPEIQSEARPAPEDEDEETTAVPRGTFVEYYLVGTLVSVAWAVGIGLLARALMPFGCGGVTLAALAAVVALYLSASEWQSRDFN